MRRRLLHIGPQPEGRCQGQAPEADIGDVVLAIDLDQQQQVTGWPVGAVWIGPDHACEQRAHDEVEVLEPESLRKDVAQTHRRAADVHGG